VIGWCGPEGETVSKDCEPADVCGDQWAHTPYLAIARCVPPSLRYGAPLSCAVEESHQTGRDIGLAASGFALPSDRRVTTPAPVEDGRAGYIDPDRCQIRRCRSEAAN